MEEGERAGRGDGGGGKGGKGDGRRVDRSISLW